MDTTDVASEGFEPNPASGNIARQEHLEADDAARSRPGGRDRRRRTATACLAGVCCLFIFLSAVTVWMHQTVISTDGFVATVGPIIERPAVTETMSVELTNQIFDVVDIQGQVKQLLPGATAGLAGPLVSVARGFVHDQVLSVLRSPTFRAVWRSVLRVTHGEVIAALRGSRGRAPLDHGSVRLGS